MEKDVIRSILSKYNEIRSEHALLVALDVESNNEKIQMLQKQVKTMDAWLGMMSREERFVVRKHLMEKLSWPYVQLEYASRWGKPQSRHERTLKRYQTRALERVSNTIVGHRLENDITALFDGIMPKLARCPGLTTDTPLPNQTHLVYTMYGNNILNYERSTPYDRNNQD